jgi:hypothetical protein
MAKSAFNFISNLHLSLSFQILEDFDTAPERLGIGSHALAEFLLGVDGEGVHFEFKAEDVHVEMQDWVVLRFEWSHGWEGVLGEVVVEEFGDGLGIWGDSEVGADWVGFMVEQEDHAGDEFRLVMSEVDEIVLGRMLGGGKDERISLPCQ